MAAITYDQYMNLLVSKIYFNQSTQYEGEDLHILRNGSTLNLNHFLDNTASPGITSIAYSMYSNLIGGNNFNNVTVNLSTGIITANSYVPVANGYQLRNFVINASINIDVIDPNNPANTLHLSITEKIRIHLHNSVTSVWVTPSPQTIRKDTSHFARFHVYALFDDGIIGDVSCDIDKLIWTVESSFASKFSIDSNGKITLQSPASQPIGNVLA